MIEIGEFRKELTRDFEEGMENVINSTNKDSFFVYVVGKRDIDNPREIRTHFIIIEDFPEKPELLENTLKELKMFGTMCFHIDKKSGKFDSLWVLPYDIPVDPYIIDTNIGGSQLVYESSVGLPVLY